MAKVSMNKQVSGMADALRVLMKEVDSTFDHSATKDYPNATRLLSDVHVYILEEKYRGMAKELVSQDAWESDYFYGPSYYWSKHDAVRGMSSEKSRAAVGEIGCDFWDCLGITDHYAAEEYEQNVQIIKEMPRIAEESGLIILCDHDEDELLIPENQLYPDNEAILSEEDWDKFYADSDYAEVGSGFILDEGFTCMFEGTMANIILGTDEYHGRWYVASGSDNEDETVLHLLEKIHSFNEVLAFTLTGYITETMMNSRMSWHRRYDMVVNKLTKAVDSRVA